MKDVLQGGQTDAGPDAQTLEADVVGLHGRGAGAEGDYIAEGPQEGQVQPAAEGIAGQPAGQNPLADDPLNDGVGEAQGQQQGRLAQAQFAQGGGNFGQMVLEDIEHQTGQNQQGQNRQQPPPHRETAGRLGLIVVTHREDAPFSGRKGKSDFHQYTTIGRES